MSRRLSRYRSLTVHSDGRRRQPSARILPAAPKSPASKTSVQKRLATSPSSMAVIQHLLCVLTLREPINETKGDEFRMNRTRAPRRPGRPRPKQRAHESVRAPDRVEGPRSRTHPARTCTAADRAPGPVGCRRPGGSHRRTGQQVPFDTQGSMTRSLLHTVVFQSMPSA
jgi:hypothetical protein